MIKNNFSLAIQYLFQFVRPSCANLCTNKQSCMQILFLFLSPLCATSACPAPCPAPCLIPFHNIQECAGCRFFPLSTYSWTVGRASLMSRPLLMDVQVVSTLLLLPTLLKKNNHLPISLYMCEYVYGTNC